MRFLIIVAIVAVAIWVLTGYTPADIGREMVDGLRTVLAGS